MASEGPKILWQQLKGKKVKSNDGKEPWLRVSSDDVEKSYMHGTEPEAQRYTRDFESFRSTPFGERAVYFPDFDQNVRVTEERPPRSGNEYKNIRDLD